MLKWMKGAQSGEMPYIRTHLECNDSFTTLVCELDVKVCTMKHLGLAEHTESATKDLVRNYLLYTRKCTRARFRRVPKNRYFRVYKKIKKYGKHFHFRLYFSSVQEKQLLSTPLKGGHSHVTSNFLLSLQSL